MKRRIVIVLSAAALFAGHAWAQETATVKRPASIRQRQTNQQHRIAQGVESGQLTPAETARLERREAALHREVRRDRASGGLTAQERDKINRQQNALSRQIYRQKHDNQQVPPVR